MDDSPNMEGDKFEMSSSRALQSPLTRSYHKCNIDSDVIVCIFIFLNQKKMDMTLPFLFLQAVH